MDKWRLIKRIETEGARQMAIDEAILTARKENRVPNTLRFFTWKPVCATIGYFQSLEKEIDIEKTKEFGIDVVRRYSGGGAVLHEHELTYSLAIAEKDCSMDVLESYRIICDALVYGLKELGLDAEFKPINDILVNNKKISGNAQTRKEGIILQHGTILTDVDVKKMFSILKVPDEKIRDKMITVVEERVTSIKLLLGKDFNYDLLENVFLKGFEKKFNVEFVVSELTDYELELAQQLYEDKYSTDSWRSLR